MDAEEASAGGEAQELRTRSWTGIRTGSVWPAALASTRFDGDGAHARPVDADGGEEVAAVAQGRSPAPTTSDVLRDPEVAFADGPDRAPGEAVVGRENGRRALWEVQQAAGGLLPEVEPLICTFDDQAQIRRPAVVLQDAPVGLAGAAEPGAAQVARDVGDPAVPELEQVRQRLLRAEPGGQHLDDERRGGIHVQQVANQDGVRLQLQQPQQPLQPDETGDDDPAQGAPIENEAFQQGKVVGVFEVLVDEAQVRGAALRRGAAQGHGVQRIRGRASAEEEADLAQRGGGSGGIGPPALDARDEAFLGQGGDGLAHGGAGDAVKGDKLMLRRQLFARRVGAAGKGDAERLPQFELLRRPVEARRLHCRIHNHVSCLTSSKYKKPRFACQAGIPEKAMLRRDGPCRPAGRRHSPLARALQKTPDRKAR